MKKNEASLDYDKHLEKSSKEFNAAERDMERLHNRLRRRKWKRKWQR